MANQHVESEASIGFRDTSEGITASRQGGSAITAIFGALPMGDLACPHCAAGPQAYSVTMPPGKEIKVHFHPADQFQVVVGGSGTLGRHQLAPGAVHYIDANTPYGPIVAGDGGMTFIALRRVNDATSGQMPADREMLAGNLAGETRAATDRRELALDPDEVFGGDAGQPARSDPDGLVITGHSLQPNQSVDLGTADGGGRSLLVVDGSLSRGAEDAGPGAVAFVAAGAAVGEVVAGAEGARLLELQFPLPSYAVSTG